MSKLNINPIKEPDKIINYWKNEKFVVAKNLLLHV